MTEQKSRILVVEDEMVVSEDLQQRLLMLGYNVVGAADTGAEAIAMAKLTRPDIVLMDIMLHGKPEGIEAAAVVRNELDIPVIYLTAHSDSTTLQQARQTNPAGYIVKPFEEDQLRVALQLAPGLHKMHKKVQTQEKKTRVMVVEDEIIVAADLQQRLQDMGFEVVGTADNKADAVALAEAEKPDIVLMDIMLHGKPEGIEAPEVMRAQFDLPVIFLTAHSDVTTLQKAKLIDPAGYVVKPFEDEQLRVALDLAPEHHKLRKKAYSQQEPQKMRRILIVEDQVVVAEDVREKLIALGYEVIAIADNSADAIAIARTERPDIVLMDIRLHGNDDGIAVASVLRWELQTPVIYLTGHSDTETLQRARATDPVAYLVQPFNDEQLRVALELAPTRQVFEQQALHGQNETAQQMAAKAFNSNEAMIITDLSGVILRVNPAFSESTDYALEEIVGRHVSLLNSERQGATLFAALWAELTEKGTWQGEVWQLRKNGNIFPCWMSARAIRDNDNAMTNFIIILTDITERKRAEEKQMLLNRDLIRTNEELRNFVYIASHDLKSPLRGIDQLATWVIEDLSTSLNPETQEHLRLIRNRINRMEMLLDDLLAYSKVGRSDDKIVQVNTQELVNDIFDLEATSRKIQLTLAENLPTFKTKKTPLELVLRNLIGNAIKHHNKDQVSITISAKTTHNGYEFSVQDDGPGIPLEHQERVFAMFQTLKPRDEVEGSGIGLAIVKKAVESMGGKITLESDGYHGCVFKFTWPINENDY